MWVCAVRTSVASLDTDKTSLWLAQNHRSITDIACSMRDAASSFTRKTTGLWITVTALFRWPENYERGAEHRYTSEIYLDNSAKTKAPRIRLRGDIWWDTEEHGFVHLPKLCGLAHIWVLTEPVVEIRLDAKHQINTCTHHAFSWTEFTYVYSWRTFTTRRPITENED